MNAPPSTHPLMVLVSKVFEARASVEELARKAIRVDCREGAARLLEISRKIDLLLDEEIKAWAETLH